MEIVNDTPTEKKSPAEDRIVLLTDGVFAIAMTLLILDIRLPEGLPSGTTFQAALLTLVPRFISYVITFAVLSAYWGTHRRLMRYLKRIDATFIRLNLVLLFFITALPIPTTFALQQNGYPDPYQLSTIIYTLSLALTGAALGALWIYATAQHRLVDLDIEQDVIDYYTLRSLIAPVFFLLSLLLLLFPIPPSSVYYSWIALSVIFFLLHRIRFRSSSKRTTISRQQPE